MITSFERREDFSKNLLVNCMKHDAVLLPVFDTIPIVGSVEPRTQLTAPYTVKKSRS
jgi:hypothetical protein